MRLILPLLLAIPMSGLAADFWHPETDTVMVAGPPGTAAEVCAYGGTSTSAAPVWGCEVVELYGAKEPVFWFNEVSGPTRVTGARWAYSFDGVDWSPMGADAPYAE